MSAACCRECQAPPAPVPLPICIVVLAIVGHKVIEAEAVVRHNEVDGVVWPALIGLVQICRAGEAGGQCALHA